MGDSDEHYPELPDFPRLPEMRGTKDEIRERYWKSFAHLIEELLRSGTRVVVVRPVPELGRQVSEIIFEADRAGAEDLEEIVAVSREYYDDRNRFINRKLDSLPSNGDLMLLDPGDGLCDAQSCFAVRDAKPLYFDSHHVSLQGATILARHALELFDRRAAE